MDKRRWFMFGKQLLEALNTMNDAGLTTWVSVVLVALASYLMTKKMIIYDFPLWRLIIQWHNAFFSHIKIVFLLLVLAVQWSSIGSVVKPDEFWVDFFPLCGRGESKARPMGYFGAGKGTIHLSNVRCTGKESLLGECPSKGQDSHVCKHGQDAGVVCDYEPEPEADVAVVGTHTCGLRAGAERRSKRIVGGYKSLRYTVRHNEDRMNTSTAHFISCND